MRFHRGVDSQQLLTHEGLLFTISIFREPFLLILAVPIPLAPHLASQQIPPAHAKSFPPTYHPLPLAESPQFLALLGWQWHQEPVVLIQLLP